MKRDESQLVSSENVSIGMKVRIHSLVKFYTDWKDLPGRVIGFVRDGEAQEVGERVIINVYREPIENFWLTDRNNKPYRLRYDAHAMVEWSDGSKSGHPIGYENKFHLVVVPFREYILGEAGVRDCPEGYQDVESAEQCTEATLDLEKNKGVPFEVLFAQAEKGCLYDGSTIVYQKQTKGGSFINANHARVCMSEPLSEPPEVTNDKGRGNDGVGAPNKTNKQSWAIAVGVIFACLGILVLVVAVLT